MKELIELKALAYDAIAQMEFHQKRLQEINAQIAQVTANLQATSEVATPVTETSVEEVVAE